MPAKTADKMVDGLTQLLEGFSSLEDKLEGELGTDSSEEEFSAAIVAEVVSALETVIESEDYTPEYIASVVSAMTQALEEVDPDVFNREEEDELEDEDDDDDDDEDLDDDDDDDE